MQENTGRIAILMRKYNKYFSLNNIDLTNPIIVKNLMMLDIKKLNISPLIIRFISNNNFLSNPNFFSELDTVIKAINAGTSIEALYNVMTSINSINSKYRTLEINYVIVNHSSNKSQALSQVIASDIKRDHHYRFILDLINDTVNNQNALMLSEAICMAKDGYRLKTELIQYLKILSITDDLELQEIIKDTITDQYFMKQRYRSSLFSTIVYAPNIELAKLAKSIICSEEGLKNKRLYYDIISLYYKVNNLEAQNDDNQSLLLSENRAIEGATKNKQYSLNIERRGK